MANWTDEKWVRVMCDFSADGLWSKDGAGVCADDLPISDALRARLREWQTSYEECEDYLPQEERATKFDRAAFSEEGQQIARAIKAELPDWTIVYFDDEKAAAERERRDGERSAFEYEIQAAAI